jgi:hypothetical protein
VIYTSEFYRFYGVCRAMTPAHTRKGGKLYRYYVSTDVLRPVEIQDSTFGLFVIQASDGTIRTD